jgi:sugar phosphate permease
VNSGRAWLVLGVTGFAYLIAVLQRGSLGVAGVEATERFDTTAAALATLAVVQLVSYAALQIPVGVMVDRVGPKALIVTGAVMMALAQASLAFAETVPLAIASRVILGLGDAMTFTSAMRLLANWFNGRTLPIVIQGLGSTGQLGQLLSTVPFSAILVVWGWNTTFLAAAALSVVAATSVLLAVRDRPRNSLVPPPGLTWSTSIEHLRDSLARPGTQLGFWSHYVTQSSGTVFALLWGFPFLAVGLGYGAPAAAALLGLIVVSAIAAGPVLGILTARFPLRRSSVVLGIVAAIMLCWFVVLAWPGTPPLWSVIVLIVVLGIGGPGSLIGFDFARTFNPLRSLGSANGIVNVGGFLASFVMMFLVGLVLDSIDRSNGGSGTPEELYSLEAFRLAFLVQVPVIGFGVVMLLRARHRARRELHQQEGIEVAPLWVAIARRWRRGAA